jgi:aspartate/methionine/tyrosine aminotransferase
MLEHAAAVPDAIMLVNGDPNFTTPGHIIDAAAKAAHAGRTGYSPGQGIMPLREALVAKLAVRNGINTTAQEICVTVGACGGLYTTLLMLLDPGDEILVPDPGWTNYEAMVHVLGAQSVPYSVGEGADWQLDPVRLEAAVTDRTKALLLNSPNNPTGSVLSEQTLRRVLEIAERHDLWVVSDEAYDELIFDTTHVSAASVAGSDRVISIFSFSKTYAMTGWRVGYVTGPREFVRELSLHQEPVYSCASTVSQYAALAALAGPQDCVGEMVAAYRHRRDTVARIIEDSRCGYHQPDGGFFVMVDCRIHSPDSWKFALAALTQAGVGVVPGAAFGAQGEGYVRLTLATAEEPLIEGVQRLVEFIRTGEGNTDGN